METDIDVAHSMEDLQLTIRGLRYSCDNSLVREILEFAEEELESLQEIAKSALERCDSKLAWDIEDAASRLSKAVGSYESYVSEPESHRLAKKRKEPESHGDGIQNYMNRNLKQEIHSFSERVKTIKAKMKEYDAEYSSTIASGGGHKSKMVGFSDLYIELKDSVIDDFPRSVRRCVRIYGMGGIGKSTLAKKLFDDRLILNYFECRAWVEVGRNRGLNEIVQSILGQANPDSNSDKMLMAEDGNIFRYLKDSLGGRRYLIVLDGVWDEWVMKEMHRLLPDDYNSSVVLVLTRLEGIVDQIGLLGVGGFLLKTVKMRLLDKEESWNLLCERVFGEEPCPFRLEKAGKKIAEHCDGLPLTIVTVADLLSEEEKTPQYWSEVAAKKNHQLFMAAYNEISEVLRPSYEHLPKILQVFFLYMGVFPQNYEIPRSKLIDMWCTDRFLEQNADKFSNDDAMKFLNELVSSSLVIIYQRTKNKLPVTYRGQIKTCGLHSALWYLSNKEARKTKFCCVLNSLDDCLGEDIEKQCRLSFHNNVLFGFNDVYTSVEDNCASTARSLLFYGPYHQYQVSIYFGLKLLRQFDALTIRFYEFPMEILQLVQLRYLALVVNGKLPASISKLSHLEFLIVNRHMSIKSDRGPSNLPLEIWNMKELQHLQIIGSNLPDPPCGASLESLSSLSNVSPLSCTECILRAIPNLEKLGIRIELAPDDDGKSLICFDHIFHLKRLKSLKVFVDNPELGLPLAPITIFSSYLENLSLSGLGYSWEEMSKLSSLPNLKVLKLRKYAFRGPKWEAEKGGFSSLLSLSIEDTDLEEWKIGSRSFPMLCNLSIRHCYKLEKIHGKFASFLEIKFVDCNPLGVKQMKEITTIWTKLDVNSSWNHAN